MNLLASKEGPDIWLIPLEWLPKHRDKLTALPETFLASQNLKQEKKGLFGRKTNQPTNGTLFPQIFASFTGSENVVDNQVFGVPLSADTLGLFANPALLEKSGIAKLPATWEEVIADVKLLTKRGGPTSISSPAIGLGTSQNVARSSEIMAALMLQNHTSLVSSDKQEALYNQNLPKQTGELIKPGVAALDFYTSFASPTKETFTFTPSQGGDFDLFSQGNLPLLIDYSFRIRDLNQKNPTLPFETGPLPQITGTSQPATLGSSLILAVPSVSSKKSIAFDAISFFTNPTNSLAYSRASGRPPARTELTKSQFDPKLTPFIAQIPIATMWYRNEINKTHQVFHLAIDAVLAGQSLDDVIDRLTKQVTHILRGEPFE